MLGKVLRFNRENRKYEEVINQVREVIKNADAICLGAGAGLSTSAGYIYTGERFDKYFYDFADKYRFNDMYSGGFYPYDTMEEFWGYWSRYIWVNRYAPIPSNLYTELYELVKDKDYFVLTTNVDHCFQRAGFDKKRLFYTQGDYGLFQSLKPSGASLYKTYDNEEIIRNMVLSQGFEIGENNELIVPKGVELKMSIPTELIPYCPDDNELMTTNLRSDDKFVEDDGWEEAAKRYSEYIRRHDHMDIVYLEMGVGGNTPGIIKYPFWRMVAENPKAKYICLNKGEAMAPTEIANRSYCVDEDVYKVLNELKK